MMTLLLVVTKNVAQKESALFCITSEIPMLQTVRNDRMARLGEIQTQCGFRPGHFFTHSK
jgi:hypothetical protein